MSDLDFDEIQPLLTGIADGQSWQDLRTTYASLTEKEFCELSRVVERCQAKAGNAWRTWTDEEVQRLRGLNYNGASVTEIAHALGRSERAVEFMLPHPNPRARS